MPHRRLLSIALLVAAAVAGSFALASCGSGNGRGEKVMDARSFESSVLYEFTMAASNQGETTLVWVQDGQLETSDLPPNSWSWSKPEVVASSIFAGGQVPAPVAAAYDSSGRLLVAWTTLIGNVHERRHPGIGIMERLRAANGKWQPARLIAQLPKKGVQDVGAAGLTLAGGKNGFALGWYEYIGVGNPNVSGFRILQGEKWLPPVVVGAEGSPVQVELFDKGQPQALWTLPIEKKLMYASLRPDGKLGKPRVLADADSFLTASSDSNQTVAAWSYKNETWASVWNGHRWASPKRLGNNASSIGDFSPITAAIVGGRSVVAWRTGDFSGGASYSLWQKGGWRKGSRSFPISGSFGPEDLEAFAFPSGEITLVGINSYTLEAIHLSPSGRTKITQISIKPRNGTNILGSASGGDAAALVWETDLGWNPGEDQHLFAWVYRR
jgi:hypothetical protein